MTPSTDWQSDPRIAYDQARRCWIFEDGDIEYVYDETAGQWREDNGDGEANEGGTTAPPPRKKHKKQQQQQQQKHVEDKRERPNCGVYVSGLPRDVDPEQLKTQLAEAFGKYGVLAVDAAGGPRVKVYGARDVDLKEKDNEKDKEEKEKQVLDLKDKDKEKLQDLKEEPTKEAKEPTKETTEETTKEPTKETTKEATQEHKKDLNGGDALVIFFRPESVALAVEMTDNADLWLQGPGGPPTRVHVEPAKFKAKPSDSKPAEKKTVSGYEKTKAMRARAKLEAKVSTWDDDDEKGGSGDTRAGANKARWARDVILENVFGVEELHPGGKPSVDAGALAELEADILSGAEAIGVVRGVTVYDLEKDGVVSVRFESAEEAEACVRVMDGRWFGGRKLRAEISDGRRRFRKSGGGNRTKTEEEEGGEKDEEEERLEEFGKWLERDEKTEKR
ncbi:uncharacterized protein SAPINGB_P002397 [Magnusiomyces paraingens]|uniref:RRM domain-containing protein n=1 Tax=Magnusiomyces paraingens TaxID=2606893 RepID=A0A5E8BDP7_9ASCO|nr:uncharacterized protein SAPINGB_P002397 [Saprochaete ingens]VVT49695.1 unnamed protein product [Saprochaete ingens]